MSTHLLLTEANLSLSTSTSSMSQKECFTWETLELRCTMSVTAVGEESSLHPLSRTLMKQRIGVNLVANEFQRLHSDAGAPQHENVSTYQLDCLPVSLSATCLPARRRVRCPACLLAIGAALLPNCLIRAGLRTRVPGGPGHIDHCHSST